MEERITTTSSMDIESIRQVGASNYHTVYIQNSPPLSYKNIRQQISGVEKSVGPMPNDLAPNRPPGSSVSLMTSKAPMGARSRPLPIPVQPKMPAPEVRSAVMDVTATLPRSSNSQQRPPLTIYNARRRPLPQPSVFAVSAGSTTNNLPSSQPSSLSSSYNSYSSGLSISNDSSLCASSTYYPHTSSPYMTSFASASRAATLPTSMQITSDQFAQEILTQPRRADTQPPSSAPPSTAGFIADTAMPPHIVNISNMETVENGNARREIKISDRHGGKRTINVETSTGLQEISAAHDLNTTYSAKATLQIPSLPDIDFGARISPMTLLTELKNGPLGGKSKGDAVELGRRAEENELGLSGLSSKKKSKGTRAGKSSAPVALQLPPPPVTLPPPPPPKSERPAATSIKHTAPTPAPFVGTVSLRPIIKVGLPTSAKKNRPVLTIKTTNLDDPSKPKKVARNAPPLPAKPSQTNLKAAYDQAQARGSSRPNAASSKNASAASFLPKVRTPAKQEPVPAPVISRDPTLAKELPPLGPGLPAHLQPAQPKSNSGGGFTTQLRKMKLLHRKSSSATNWNWIAQPPPSSTMVIGTLQPRSNSTPAALSSASAVQNQSQFGQRHPYGYQRGAATWSMHSVAATSDSSVVPQQPHSVIVSFPPSHQPLYSAGFQSAPQPPSLPPTDSKKSIGSLWTKFKFGSTRKPTTTTAPTAGKGGGFELW